MNLNSISIGSVAPKRRSEYYARWSGEPGSDEGGYTGWQIGNGGIREPYRPDEEREMWIPTLADPGGNYFQLVGPM